MLLLTKEQVAKRLGVTPRTCLRYVAARQLPFVRLPGGGVRFSDADIDQWIMCRRIVPKQSGHRRG